MTELLKISELAERAGVQKATVAYYIKEGLLPRPVRKPHRNMAYYAAESVERIKLIKELQTKRFLPLAVIKRMFSDRQGIEEIRGFVDGAATDPKRLAARSVAARELMAETGLTAAQLKGLTDLGYLHGARAGGKVVYSSAEAAIVRALVKMRKAGLGDAGAFGAAELALYKESMEELIRKEIALFSERVVGRLPRQDVLTMARAAIEGTNDLLIALRRKLLMDFLGDGASLPAKPRPRRKRPGA